MGVCRAVNIAIKYRNTWYRRYFFQYCTQYCNSFILLVSHAYRRYFLIVLPILDTNTLFWVIALLLRDSFLWGWLRHNNNDSWSKWAGLNCIALQWGCTFDCLW